MTSAVVEQRDKKSMATLLPTANRQASHHPLFGTRKTATSVRCRFYLNWQFN
jgi:hypothetical protein